MKGRFFSKKEWRKIQDAQMVEVNEAYNEGRRDASKALAADCLADALWQALVSNPENDPAALRDEQTFHYQRTKDVGYTVYDGRICLYKKSLLPDG